MIILIFAPENQKTINMNIINFFHNAPVLATLITLVYATIWGVFVYILIRMYKK